MQYCSFGVAEDLDLLSALRQFYEGCFIVDTAKEGIRNVMPVSQNIMKHLSKC